MFTAADCASFLKAPLTRSFARGSRRKVEILANQISSLILGYRTACLIDCFGGSDDHSQFTSLRTTLRRLSVRKNAYFTSNLSSDDASILFDGLGSLFFVCHVPSSQIFLVNWRKFAERVTSGANGEGKGYVRVNRDSQPSVQPRMPDYLSAMLEIIGSHDDTDLSDLQPPYTGVRPTHDMFIDVGLSRQGAVLNCNAVEGIALAGWLLDYEVIYYYDVDRHSPHQILRCSFEESELPKFDAVWLEPQANNLDDRSLLLFQVDLISNQSGEQTRQNLFAFTCPQQCAAEIFGSEDAAVEHVKRSVKQKIGDRDRFEILMSVTSQDRVAL